MDIEAMGRMISPRPKNDLSGTRAAHRGQGLLCEGMIFLALEEHEQVPITSQQSSSQLGGAFRCPQGRSRRPPAQLPCGVTSQPVGGQGGWGWQGLGHPGLEERRHSPFHPASYYSQNPHLARCPRLVISGDTLPRLRRDGGCYCLDTLPRQGTPVGRGPGVPWRRVGGSSQRGVGRRDRAAGVCRTSGSARASLGGQEPVQPGGPGEGEPGRAPGKACLSGARASYCSGGVPRGPAPRSLAGSPRERRPSSVRGKLAVPTPGLSPRRDPGAGGALGSGKGHCPPNVFTQHLTHPPDIPLRNSYLLKTCLAYHSSRTELEDFQINIRPCSLRNFRSHMTPITLTDI